MLSFGKGPVVSKEKEQEQRELPDYLPEDEENTEPSGKVTFEISCLQVKPFR